MSDNPQKPTSSFPKLPATTTARLAARTNIKVDPTVPGKSKPSGISFLPTIPTEPAKKPVITPNVASAKPRKDFGPHKPKGPKGKSFGPPGMGPSSSISTNLSSPNIVVPFHEPIVAAEPAKRKPKDYSKVEIAPTAQSMSINPLDSSHPMTLPFLDPHTANPSLYNVASNVKMDVTSSQMDTKDTIETKTAYPKPPVTHTVDMLFKSDSGTYSGEDQLFFIQMPTAVPLGPPPKPVEALTQDILGYKGALTSIPSGNLGRLQIFKSGKVKLIIGDTAFDVSTGMPCNFYQEVAVLDTESKKFFQLGEISKRMVCYPDLSQVIPSPQDEGS